MAFSTRELDQGARISKTRIPSERAVGNKLQFEKIDPMIRTGLDSKV